MQVWIADDDQSIRWVLEQACDDEGIGTRCFADATSLLGALEDERPDVVVTDIRMPGVDGLDLLHRLHGSDATLPVIVITAYSDLDSAVAAYQGGAFEYLPKPFDIDKAVDLIRRAGEQSENELPQTGIDGGFPGLIGRAPAMQEVFRAIGRLSGSSMTVLITGQSGTGKELVARALHQHSPRAARAFVALNTSAITAELLESELFGHERGAFTGADSRRIGRFEQADGGTLFLDEIGDMSAALQTRLLRVLAEGEFYRVGGQVPIRVDTRVVAATNQDLPRKVQRGEFREDLFHRLNVIHIEMPPLRDRREDIPLLLDHYLRRAAGEIGVTPKQLTETARELLCAFEWPGNVRQLVNACRRLTLTAPGREVQPADIPAEFGGHGAVARTVDDDWPAQLARWADAQLRAGKADLLKEAMPVLESTLIRIVLERVQGKRQEAARLLGWGRNTLTRKIREFGLE